MSYITKVAYTGNGSLKEYTVPFPYLRKDDVLVYLADTLVTTYGWLTDTQIQFTTAPANAVEIRIERNTYIDESIVDYADGSTLTETDLDQSDQQQIYKDQELQEQIDELREIIDNITVVAGNLPPVDNDDNGKILIVAGGEWTLYLPTDVTALTNYQIDGTSYVFQKKTTTFKAISPGTESAWTTIHTGAPCPD